MEPKRLFKRKIYDRLLKWKQESNGNSALLIEGARRIGKSTIVQTFARNEYESFILIDFTKCSQEIKNLFNDVSDLNYIFLRLQLVYGVQLVERKSLIVFDEVEGTRRTYSFPAKSNASVCTQWTTKSFVGLWATLLQSLCFTAFGNTHSP